MLLYRFQQVEARSLRLVILAEIAYNIGGIEIIDPKIP